MNFIPEKQVHNLFGNGGYTFNDIVSTTFINPETGGKETTYTNIDGNWNANGRLMLNLPLRNIKFSVFSMTFAGYNHTNGFSNGEKNLSRRTNLGQNLGLNYRSDVIDFGIRGNINYNNVRNSLEGQQNQEYFNYNASANTIIYLPYDFSIGSDITYNTNSGYSGGFEQEGGCGTLPAETALQTKTAPCVSRYTIFTTTQQHRPQRHVQLFGTPRPIR